MSILKIILGLILLAGAAVGIAYSGGTLLPLLLPLGLFGLVLIGVTK